MTRGEFYPWLMKQPAFAGANIDRCWLYLLTKAAKKRWNWLQAAALSSFLDYDMPGLNGLMSQSKFGPILLRQ